MHALLPVVVVILLAVAVTLVLESEEEHEPRSSSARCCCLLCSIALDKLTKSQFANYTIVASFTLWASCCYLCITCLLCGRAGSLYGELARFVFRLLGFKPKPKDMQLQPHQKPGAPAPGQPRSAPLPGLPGAPVHQAKAHQPHQNPSSGWDSVWAP